MKNQASEIVEERVASLSGLLDVILDVEPKTLRRRLLAIPLLRRALAHPCTVGSDTFFPPPPLSPPSPHRLFTCLGGSFGSVGAHVSF